MTPQQIDLIVESFALVMKQKDEAGLAFYTRLFTLAPELRILFKPDLKEQARKLMDTLACAVAKLHDLANIEQALRDLGARHAALGAKPEHYPVVGTALILTLENALGDAFDAETRLAWLLLYSRVSKAMLAGAWAAPAQPEAAARARLA